MLKLKPRKTVEDWMKLPAGTLAELIGGEIFMTPSPAFNHQDIQAEIAARLRLFVSERNLGKVVAAPMDVHLASGDILQPDVLFIRTANLGIIKQWVMGSPDLVVEIVSPDRPERDLVVKRDLYARHGVAEYWIVSPELKSIEVLTLHGKEYAPHAYFESGDSLTTPSLPGFSLPLGNVFPAK